MLAVLNLEMGPSSLALAVLQAPQRLHWEYSDNLRLARHSLDVCWGHLHEAQVPKVAWDIF